VAAVCHTQLAGRDLAAARTAVGDAVLFLCRAAGRARDAERLMDDLAAHGAEPARREWVRALVLALGAQGHPAAAVMWYERLRASGTPPLPHPTPPLGHWASL
jgi:hypothetical protein